MAIGFRVVIFLLTTNYVHTSDRLARVHRLGHLIRVHVLAERLQGMHDSNFTGKTASQSRCTAGPPSGQGTMTGDGR